MKKRIYNESNLANINFELLESESYLSAWLLSYCLLVSSAENFIVRTASLASQSTSNSKLNEELKLCFFQETQHAKTHTEFNKLYLVKNSPMRIFGIISNFLNYTLIEGVAPLSLKLAAASAMEQLNAEISYFGFKRISQLSSDREFTKLLTWHFVEEIEHRDVVFDLLKEKRINSFTKNLGMIIVLLSFTFWITLGSLIVSTKSSKPFKKTKEVLGRDGIIHLFFKTAFRYFETNYHPNIEKIPEIFFMTKENI